MCQLIEPNRKPLLTVILCLTIYSSFSQIMFCDPAQPAFPECEVITCAVCDLNGFTGSSAGFGNDPDGDLSFFFCSIVHSVQYVEFYAAATSFSITVTVSNCNVNAGVTLGVMHHCDEPLIACVPGNGTNSTTLPVGPLIVGETYILIIDIGATNDCDYSISVNPPNATTPFIPPNLTMQGDFNVCPHALTTYQVSPVLFMTEYVWTFPPGATVVDHSPDMSLMFVSWGNTGGNVCVTANAPCNAGSSTICHNVTVMPIPPTIFPPVKICSEDAPYILPWGTGASTSGTFSTTLSSFQGCDSILRQTVTVLPTSIHTLPPTELCEGSCITVCGGDYCDYGNYSVICQSIDGCDSIVNFSIVAPNLVADIQGPDTITCAMPSLTLLSSPSSGVKTWYDATGQQVGTGNNINVNTAGVYYLNVTKILAGETCSRTDSIVIALDTSPPSVTATGVMVGCDTAATLLHAVSSASPAVYSWSGPDGFSSGLQNPPVTVPGMYIVTVLNPATGCSGRDTAYATLCCADFAGTLDTTALLVCGPGSILAGFHNDQNLGSNDSLVFVLYSSPADPLGSILMMMQTPLFPFIAGMLFYDSTYYVASLAAPLLPDGSIDLYSACLSISAAEPVKWVPKPTISLGSAPTEVCTGLCMDITFQFTGLPPFQFHYNISQNGQPLMSQDETSDALQKTITVCPDMFSQQPGSGAIDFNVSFLKDLRCGCND